MKDTLILAIESSCDETAASVVKNGRTILSNVISSQIALHTLYGGVVPEIASRKHIEKINQVIEQALADADVTLDDLDAIGVTYGPGLVGALLVGVAEAKAIAYAKKLPLVGVHHIEGHVSANYIEHPDLEPPFLCLIVSGGHTHLVIVKDYGEFEILGRTRDDAAGEAFDKVARAIGLGYPGGPKVDKLAQLAYSFDIALQNELTLDENIELARAFCREQFVAHGMIVDLAVHEGKSKNEDEPDNPHFHVLAPIRPFTEKGSWGNKQKREYVLDEDGNRIKDAKGKDIFNAVSTTGWNDPELLKEWRRAWTEKVNEKFRECHMAARIDHRSYKEQGIDLIPTIHEGYEVRAMEKKGIKTVIGELNRAIRQFNQMFISLKESIQWMKTVYKEMKAELDRRQNPTLLESLQDYYDKKTQGRPPLPNYYGEMKRKGKNLSNLQEFSKSINYLQIHQIETMDDLQERIEELNGVVSVSKKEISEKREQLKKLENLEKMAEVIKTNQPLIDEYNRFYFQKRREKYYQQHKKEINYYRKCERELKQHLDKNGKVPTARWKREKEELQAVIEELKADNLPYQQELSFVKKVQSCADIARRNREMAEADTSGRSEEKSEKETKFPVFHAVQTEDIFEENGKEEQQPVNQSEQKPEKKTSLLRKLDEKKKECAERDAKQQIVKKKRNHEMSL